MSGALEGKVALVAGGTGCEMMANVRRLDTSRSSLSEVGWGAAVLRFGRDRIE